MDRTPFFRQTPRKKKLEIYKDKIDWFTNQFYIKNVYLFLCTGIWTLYFMQGLCFGLPTVLVPQLKRANYTVGIKETSLLVSLQTYSGIPWVFILSASSVIIGRKKSHIITCITACIGFSIFYFSTDFNHFLIGEIFQGALFSCQFSTNLIILTEYISPKYRGVFLTIKSATFFWGVLVANTIGTFFHWRNIVILSLFGSVYTLLNVIIWPESPMWLASKNKFAQCSESHRWLKGCGESSEKELQELLKLHEKRRHTKEQWSVKYLFSTVSRIQFWKPILVSNLLVFLYSFTGKMTCTVYAIDILRNISNDDSTAYSGMLILDAVTVVSMYFGCVLSKFIRRRVILISFSIVGIITMFIIALYLYLANLAVIKENKFISLSLLAIYTISISCGPMILSTSMMGELLPLKSRILSLCVVGVTYELSQGTFAKLSPLCFKNLGMHGTFLLFGIFSLTFLILLYFYLPETKDKTLQEIGDCLKGKDKNTFEEMNRMMA